MKKATPTARRLVTAAGSTIERADPVGKRVGGQLYLHRDYLHLARPELNVATLERRCPFPFRCVMLDADRDLVRLDEALDFDSAREPSPGRMLTLRGLSTGALGQATERSSSSIWHHKQLWVQDDYPGFDVDAAWRWSERWLAALTETASGSPKVWEQQLMASGLKGPTVDTSKWPALNTKLVDLATVIPYARNSNVHPPEQVRAIAAGIRHWGWTIPILIDPDGNLIAGHGRVLAAELLQLTEVPAATAHGWSEAQRRAYILADNHIARMATTDVDLMRLEMADLGEADFDLGLTGVDMDVLQSTTKTKRRKGGTSPDDLAQDIDGEQRDALETLAGFKTAIERTEPSAPVALFTESGFLRGSVLDLGAGHDIHEHVRFDPAFDADYDVLAERYDVVMCNYVLNVMPLEHERAMLLLAMRTLLGDDGVALVSVWRKTKAADQVTASGYQCSWSLGQYEELFGRVFGNVARIKAPFWAWKLRP